MTYDDLIKGKASRPKVPAKALRELKKVLAYNDGQHIPSQRIGWHGACELLASYGWPCGRDMLKKVCRELGRESYAKK